MASRPLTMTILGGGSFYSPSFIGTMCSRPEVFTGAEVRLHDPNAERVALVKAFCEKFTASRGVAMSFRSVPDLDRSLEGVDFAIATFRVGGVRSLMLDESIPPRFGYFGNETVGPGGLFMAMRTVPVLLDMAGRLKRLSPKGWLLNYANPTNFIGDALRRTGHDRTVALCDGFICPPRDIGATVGLDFNRVHTRHAGINHCSWVYEARAEGRDLLAEMAKMSVKDVEANTAGLGPDGQARRLRWFQIFRLMERYPAPAGHAEPFFFQDEWVALQRRRHADGSTYHAEHDRKNWDSLKAVLASWDDAAAAQVARTHFGGHADLAIGVAAALATGSGEVFPVNVPHGGAVPGFSPDTVLEVYCKTTDKGFEPLPVPAFPKALHAQQSQLAAFEQLAVTGILEKDRRKLLQALAIHPFTRSIQTAEQLFDAMWNEEQDLLGEYWTKA